MSDALGEDGLRGPTPTYENPVLRGCNPDPSITRAGSDYYLVTSSFEYFPGIPIFHSRDLVNWRQIGHVLTRASQLPLASAKSSQGIFAPSIRYNAGTFYVVTTNMSHGGAFIVTAKDPAGPWSEPIWLNETDFAMDPSLWFDDDGKVYYTRHGEKERGGIFQAEIDLEAGKLLERPRKIWSGTGGIWPEGPHLYKVGAKYYLLISEGGTSYDHSLTVARSDTPWGPFEAAPHNPILTHRHLAQHPIQATGHADLVQLPDGSWWMVLLGIRPTPNRHHHLGRETFLTRVTWNAEGWPVVNDGQPLELRMRGDGLPPRHPWPADQPRDDFDAAALSFAWNHLRNPRAEDVSLDARPGFLRLTGTGTTLDDEGSPAFVGRRQQHFRVRASTSLEFEPRAEGQEAGLTVRANENNHYDLAVISMGGRRWVLLRTRRAGTTALVNRIPITDGPVILSVSAEPDRYDFFVGAGAADRVFVGSAPTAPLASEAAGTFTGAYFGLYAQSVTGTTPPADFDWFEYEPLGDQSIV